MSEQHNGTAKMDNVRILPAGWKWKKLCDVGVFDSGGTPSKENPKFWGGSIPFVTGADITDLHINYRHARAFLSEAGMRSGKTGICKPGTVLFVTRTRVGRIGIAEETVCVSQDLSPYTCGKELVPEFVARYLLYVSPWLVKNSRGATIQGLTRDFVDNIKIPLPPLSEQKRIAAILNEQLAEVDKARAAAEAQLEAAKALPAAYLREVFPRPGQELPAGWKWVKLGEVCDRSIQIRNPQQIPGYDFYYIDITSVDNIQKKIIQARKLSGAEAPSRARKVVKYNDVLVATTRPNLNAVAMVPDYLEDQICSTGFCVLRASIRILPEYLFAFTNSVTFVKALSDLVRGALYPAVTDGQVYSQPLPLPPFSVQESIAASLNEQLAAVGKARNDAETQLKEINALPSSLLRKAFNGEL